MGPVFLWLLVGYFLLGDQGVVYSAMYLSSIIDIIDASLKVRLFFFAYCSSGALLLYVQPASNIFCTIFAICAHVRFSGSVLILFGLVFGCCMNLYDIVIVLC